MKYRVVKTDKGKVLVDESAEIKEGAYYFNHKLSTCQKRTSGTDDESYVGFCKITATINHSIDKDVPMVVVEDNEAERLMKFLKGRQHKAAQQNGGYSEEDIRKAIQFGEDLQISPLTYNIGNTPRDNFIQSLNQEYIELEMFDVECNCSSNDEMSKCVVNCYKSNARAFPRIKTDRVAGQLMAYLKTNK